MNRSLIYKTAAVLALFSTTAAEARYLTRNGTLYDVDACFIPTNSTKVCVRNTPTSELDCSRDTRNGWGCLSISGQNYLVGRGMPVEAKKFTPPPRMQVEPR